MNSMTTTKPSSKETQQHPFQSPLQRMFNSDSCSHVNFSETEMKKAQGGMAMKVIADQFWA